MRRPLAFLPASILLACAAGPAAAASITGVCPDGSIFIVQDRDRIPCARAKEVAPSDVPPMRPEYLPRPYSWQVYREGANPNNPYNLIDAARRVREMQGNLPPGAGAPEVGTTQIGPRGAFGGGATARNGGPPGGAGAAPRSFAAPGVGAAGPAAPPLTLAHEEIRDLFLIVELAQQAAPGRFVKENALGEPTLEVSFAHSAAFETRVRDALPRARGRVLVFTVLAHEEASFHPNFTFVQGHETFRPSARDPGQMGFLEGAPGPLAAQDVALGYVVLTDRMDPGQSLDLYWNDRRIETRLLP